LHREFAFYVHVQQSIGLYIGFTLESLTGHILSVQFNQFVQSKSSFVRSKFVLSKMYTSPFIRRRSVSANVDGDEQLIGATCDSDVGSGLADEVLMFTSVDSTGLQVDGVDGPGAGQNRSNGSRTQ